MTRLTRKEWRDIWAMFYVNEKWIPYIGFTKATEKLVNAALRKRGKGKGR